MIGEINYIADVRMYVDAEGNLSERTESKYKKGKFRQFMDWLDNQRRYQLDIETNVCEKWNEFQLISLQFGSAGRRCGKRQQWFIQWSELSEEEKQELRVALMRKHQLKIIHNAKFEYIVLKFHGITLSNIYDTMLAEKVLRGGESNEDYALADMSWKYLRVIMDKSEQQSFGDNIITDSKIRYGITDVAYLDIIMRTQMDEAAEMDRFGFHQQNTIALEMEALLGFSDITFEGMQLDVEKWRANVDLARPIVQAALDKMNEWLLVEPFNAYALKKGHIANEDRIVINYNSHHQKRDLMKLLFPGMNGATKNIVAKYLSTNGKKMDDEDISLLLYYQEGKYEDMTARLLKNHRDELIAMGLLIPAGMATINWNSQDQVLPLIQTVLPKLTALKEEERNKFHHKILVDLGDYWEKGKLLTTYGEEFIIKHLCSDGMVRSNFNQVISTGRVSSSNPNMQNIIVGDKIAIKGVDENGLRYRNAFICKAGWKYVDSDFASQELCIIAELSQDPTFLDALANGYDLHAVCADLVFGWEWKNGADTGCKYYEMAVGPDGKLRQAKAKCKCKKHKVLRDKVKPINFGLAYGMTEFKLAGTLDITIPEARALIAKYFNTFPRIGEMLESLGNFALWNGYVMTLAPFCRKRWFPYWHEWRNYVEAHISGAKFYPRLGQIERAGKNMPIQGASADITKLAMVMIRNFIHENNLQDSIKLVAQVHDQITTLAKEEIADWWKDEMDRIMREAALVVIPSGILVADTNVTPFWTK